jgi:chromosome segregation ATPase
MDGNFFKGLFSRVAGREPKDEVDAATLAAELSGLREKTDVLATELAGATSKVSELTEKLEKANEVISEYKAAEAERREADQAAQVKAALEAGKIAPGQIEWAKANFEAFLSLVESTEPGTYGPPKGRVVSDEAINKADSTSLSDSSAALDVEAKEYAREHNVPYHAAVLAVMKRTSGKGE